MDYTINNADINTMFDEHEKSDAGSSKAVVARNDLVFTAAVLPLLAGLLLPLSPQVLDMFWGLSLCFTMVLIIIAFSAKNSHELSSYPSLMFIAAIVRIVLAAATGRMILLNDVGCIIVESTGKLISAVSPAWVLIIIPITAIVFVTIIGRSSKKISETSLTFTLETTPIKKIGVKNDMNMGLINTGQAEELSRRIANEERFYVNMIGISKMLWCDAAIAGLIVIVTILGQAFMISLNKIGADSQTALSHSVGLAAGGAILSLVPSLFVSMASGFLLTKSSMTLSKQPEGEQRNAEKIEIVSDETGERETVELLNPEFVSVMEKTEAKPIVAEAEVKVVDFEPVGTKQEGSVVTAPKLLEEPKQFCETGDYYSNIASKVAMFTDNSLPTIFAARKLEHLPVTVAINTAIKLAKKGLSCLIIDTDAKRNAVAKVFDIKSDAISDAPVATCIEKVSIATGRSLKAKNLVQLKENVKEICSGFDRVVIYAPHICSTSTFKTLSAISSNAIVFTRSGKNDKLARLFDRSDCNLAGIIEPHEKKA